PDGVALLDVADQGFELGAECLGFPVTRGPSRQDVRVRIFVAVEQRTEAVEVPLWGELAISGCSHQPPEQDVAGPFGYLWSKGLVEHDPQLPRATQRDHQAERGGLLFRRDLARA